MNLKNLLHSMRRRWYIMLGGILIAGALCGLAYSNISPTYQRSASVLLIPGSTSIPAGGNPYLYLGGLAQASDVLVRALSADEVLTPILGPEPAVEVTIARDTTTSGPIVVISVSGTDDAQVAAVFTEVLGVVPTTFDNLQASAGVADDAKVTTLPLTVDTTSTLSQKSRLQAIGVVGVGTLAATLLLTGFIDGLLLAPRRPRGRRSTATVVAFPGYDDEERALARISRHQNTGSIALPTRKPTPPPTVGPPTTPTPLPSPAATR